MNILKKIFSTSIYILIVFQSVLGMQNNKYSNVKTQLLLDSINATNELARQYYLHGDYSKSIYLLKSAYSMSKELDIDASIDVARILINLSRIYSNKWEYDSALFYLNQAENIYLSNTKIEKEYIGGLYSNIGRQYQNMGDNNQARIFYKKAITYLSDADLYPFDTYAIILYHRMGLLENSEHNYDKSIQYFSRSLEMAKAIEGNTYLLINSYLNLSLPYAELKQYNKSIILQHKAIELCLLDSINNTVRLGKLYNNISLDYLELNQFDNAEYYLNMSLKIAQSNVRRTIYLSDIYDSYGRLLESKSDYDLALAYYQKGIINLSKGFEDTNPLNNPIPTQIINKFSALQLLKSKTSCLYETYKTETDFTLLEAAINTSKLSMQLIDDLRNSYLSRESKLQLASHEDDTYKSALDMCYLAYEFTSDTKYSYLAFTIAEKTKSSVLLSSLREMEAKEFGGIPQELLTKERVLSKRIAFYKENIYEENQNITPDSSKIQTWETYLFQEQRAHDELIQQFEYKYPKYFSLKFNTKIVTPKLLQKSLKKSSVLEYAISDSSLYTFLIENEKFIIYRERIDSNFADLILSYLSLFQEFDFSKQSYSSFTEYCWQSMELYNYLIRPIEDEITGNHLLIIPDGILSYLPFETLIRQVPTEIPNEYYRDLHYLLYDYAVSYSYSSSLYHQAYSGTQAKGKKKLAAFAPEYSMNSAFHVSNDGRIVTRQKYRKNLYPIPGVLEEIEAISKITTSDIFSGHEASETTFRKVAGKYDLLHLAMHTVVDNKDPMFSKLIFSDTPDSNNDGLLNTYEIYGLRLRARMVVLSACSTGEGDYRNGEGVMSLARGFVYAGSPSLIMTMWEVEDKSSISLMKSFYQNLFDGKTKPTALQDAKIEFIRNAKPENTHPFFWSSYVVLGNTQAIAWKTRSVILLITLSLLMITMLVFTGYKLYIRFIQPDN